ncbi:TonB-dependent receptor [Niveispirillum sp. KHB5.9]|uniref:TonB-dependent receptor n=1 Tax=Niveispirillum sp. KHB5.9 TaxID=3400269 RepID=UPI003A8AA436
MQFKKMLMRGTASAIAMMAIAATAHAQGAPAAGSSGGEIEEIVVTGIRASLVQSLNTKRNADAIVDAISAEDIGKFPDKNVAESLSHLPGVQVDRDFGEGERVAIRGTDPALNRTLLNGQTVASTDWFILDAPGRTFNYAMLAPEVVGQLEVYKSPEARIDEGSIGGTVILHTRRPLDLDPLTLNASLEYAYNDRSEKGSPNASGLFSWSNDSSTFGVLASVTHQEQDIRRDGFESLGYPTVTLPGGGTAIMPNVINSALFEQKRERTGGTLAIQAKPSDNLEINATGLYVKGTYDNLNQSRYYFNNFRGTPNNAVVKDGVVVSGSYTNAGTPTAGLMLLDAIARESTIETYATDLKVDYTGDAFKASFQGGYTKSTGGTKQQYFGEFEQLVGYSFDISGNNGLASVTPEKSPTSAQGIGLGFAPYVEQPTSDEETYAQADVTRDVDLGLLNAIRFGVKYRKHETTQDSQRRNAKTASDPFANFAGGETPDGYMSGLNVNDALKNWVVVDRDKLKKFFTDRPDNQFNSLTIYDFLPSIFAVEEEIWSGYTQANFEGDGFRGNVGLRYVHTDQTSRGPRDLLGGVIGDGFTPPPGDPPAPPRQIVNVALDKSYDDFLPSLNLAFDVNEKSILRFSASRVMARANYADLSTFLEVNNTLHTANGGNPDLDPYRANSFDASFEYYLDKVSLVSATLFYKDIGSYIYRATSTEMLINTDTNPLTNPGGTTIPQAFEVSRPRNGGSAEIKGFELAYRGDIYENFGIEASYTFADSETADASVALPFSSKHSFTLTPYYEDDMFSARVTYSYRSKYFREVNRATSVINDGYNQLDASLTVNVTEQIALTAQAQNLLDETQYQYVGNRNVPFAAYKNGRRFFGGVRFSY